MGLNTQEPTKETDTDMALYSTPQQPQAQPRKYLSISKQGQITYKDPQTGAVSSYSMISGTLESIYKKSSTFGHEIVERWYTNIKDGEEAYTLCLPYTSGTYRSLILALASCSELTATTPIQIETYLGKNGYPKVRVFADGVKLDWYKNGEELPPLQETQVGSKVVKDDTARTQYIESLTKAVVERLNR